MKPTSQTAGLLILVLLSSFAFGTAAASGKLTNPDTSGPIIGGYAQFDLQNCGGNFPQVAGSSISGTQRFLLAADGSWSGIIYRNDEIFCNGQATTTWRLTYFVSSLQVGIQRFFICSQSSCLFDGSGSLTPLNANPAPPAPQPPATGARTFLCSFTSASTWTCVHNMASQFVDTEFFDSNFKEIVPDSNTATDVNTITATFLQPQSGYLLVINSGNFTPTVINPNYLISNPTSDQSISGDHALILGGSLSAKRIEGERYFDGGVVGFASLAAAYADLPSTGGTVRMGPGTITDNTPLTLVAGKPLHLIGAGMDVTNIAFNGAGYYITQNATDVTNSVTIENSSFTTGSTATGFLKVGSTSTNYDEAIFRLAWHLSNVTVYGPGASVAGSIGMSLTQIITAKFDNVIIRNYEQTFIWDRCGESVLDKVRWWGYKFGPLFSVQAGTGSPATGSDGTKINGGAFLGPTTGSGNYGFTIDAALISTDHMEWELQTAGGAAAAFAHITANGQYFHDSASYFSLGGGAVSPTNLMVWDNGYIAPKFFGTILTVTLSAISAGTPNAGIFGNRGEMAGTTGPLSNACLAVSPAKCIAYGQDANNFFDVSAEALQVRVGGGFLMLNVDGNGLAIGNTSNLFLGTFVQANTANRIYTLPNSSFIVAGSNLAQSWAGNQSNMALVTPTATGMSYPRTNITLANGANVDIALSGTNFAKIIGPSAVFSVSGFAAGVDGRELKLFNSVAFAMTIKNEDAGDATAVNRITTLTGADVTLRAGTSFATFIYDGASSRWILEGTN